MANIAASGGDLAAFLDSVIGIFELAIKIDVGSADFILRLRTDMVADDATTRS